MSCQYDYAVIGGDLRQVYLVEALAGETSRVCHFALCKNPDKSRFSDTAFINAAGSLEEACRLSACIIGPIPLCGGDSVLSQHAFDIPLSLDSIFSGLKSDQSFFGGCIPEKYISAATQRGAHVFELMKDVSLSYYNTIATAEGAICEAIRQSPWNLRGSSCAILGYGKCARTLCQYLKGMGCITFIAARREEAVAQASVISDNAGNLKDFLFCAGTFDFIFNTIPAPVITREALARMKSTVTIIDIASSPGGVDFEAAQGLGIHASLCPGLPGKYAPAASAEEIRKTVKRILKEIGRSK